MKTMVNNHVPSISCYAISTINFTIPYDDWYSYYHWDGDGDLEMNGYRNKPLSIVGGGS